MLYQGMALAVPRRLYVWQSGRRGAERSPSVALGQGPFSTARL